MTTAAPEDIVQSKLHLPEDVDIPPKINSRGDRKKMVARPAIMCANPSSISETFVRRHISKLNGGDTLILGEQNVNSLDSMDYGGRYIPILSKNVGLRRALRLAHRGGLPKALCKNLWKKQIGIQILPVTVDYLLFEFGYILARHYDFALFSDIPFFVYFRGQDASRKLLKQDSYVKTLQKVLPRAAGVVFVSDTLRKNLKNIGVPLPRTAVIPSGVESGEFYAVKKQPFSAISVGRFVEKKGHEDTIQAMRKVVDAIPEFQLNIIGDGPLLEQTRALVQRLRLENNVNFCGALRRSEVAKKMSVTKFYIQSSKLSSDGDTEGFPSAIQEALSSGCIVFSTAHSGASDFLSHKYDAFLHAEGDYSSLALNIVEAQEDPMLLEQMVLRARNLVEKKFEANKCIEQFEGFVQDCLQGRKNERPL